VTTVSNNSYHHGDLKKALLIAAKNLLVEKGIDALSLRSIATQVGVSHMAPYAHFKNKSELFKSVAAEGFIELSNQLEQIHKETNNNPKELVLLYGVAYIEFATQNPQLYKLMLSQTHPDSNLSSKSSAYTTNELILKEASKRPYVLLREGFALNETNEKRINVQAQGAWALVHGVASLIITGQIVILPESTIKEFLGTAIQGMKF
jgi:AcrR family transcriptional regulator